jgi:hypothetical protein
VARKKRAKGAEGNGAVDARGVDAEVMLRQLSVGAEMCGLGFELQRGDVDLEHADRALTDARLEVCLSVAPDQAELFDGALPELRSVADCHRLSVGVGTVAGRLTFARGDVDLETLATFAGKNAHLRASRLGDAGHEAGAPAAEGVTFEVTS